VPLLALGFVLAFFVREIALSDTAGMVARGEAVTEEQAQAALREAETTAEGASAAPGNAERVEAQPVR
jgi:hypothetical protein